MSIEGAVHGVGRLLGSSTFRVCMADTDAAGVIYFGAPLRWAEALTTEWLVSSGISIPGLLEDGTGIPVVNANSSYKAPVRIAEVMTGRLWWEDRTETTYTLRAEFGASLDEPPAVIVRITHAHVEMVGSTMTSSPISERILSALEGGSWNSNGPVPRAGLTR